MRLILDPYGSHYVFHIHGKGIVLKQCTVSEKNVKRTENAHKK